MSVTSPLALPLSQAAANLCPDWPSKRWKEAGPGRWSVLGFYIQSRLNMNDIKSAIGIHWLQHNCIYLRPQRMSFAHGTDLFLIGYLAKEHPLTANMHDLENNIRAKWLPPKVHTLDNEAMEDIDEQEKPSTEFVALLKVLTERGLIKDQQLHLRRQPPC
jgi:hypothetical protein